MAASALVLPQPPPRFSERTEFDLYSICLELANNIIKHAQATNATIALSEQNGELYLTVSDNGVGINGQRTEGRGLRNVADRVSALGGTWSVESEPGGGAAPDCGAYLSIPYRKTTVRFHPTVAVPIYYRCHK